MKIDPIVKKETGLMALGCLICTAIAALVFVILGKFDRTVALGCLIGYVLAVGNFFVMSHTLTKAIGTGDEVTAKLKMKQSYVTRSVIMLVIMAASIIVEWIHWVPVIASVFYPRIVIFVRGIVQSVRNRREGDGEEKNYVQWEEDDDEEETDEFEKFVGGFSKSNPPVPKKPEKPKEQEPEEEKKE